jgi:hypothetical protein
MARKEDSENRKDDEHEQTLSRREFLHLAGLAAGGGALFAATSELLFTGVVNGEGSASPLIPATVPQAPLPSHRALLVDGIHAYADRLSVKPGETISFHVSSDAQYTMQIYRLGLDPDTPDSDQPMSNVIQVTSPSRQPIHPGSFLDVGVVV